MKISFEKKNVFLQNQKHNYWLSTIKHIHKCTVLFCFLIPCKAKYFAYYLSIGNCVFRVNLFFFYFWYLSYETFLTCIIVKKYQFCCKSSHPQVQILVQYILALTLGIFSWFYSTFSVEKNVKNYWMLVNCPFCYKYTVTSKQELFSANSIWYSSWCGGYNWNYY